MNRGRYLGEAPPPSGRQDSRIPSERVRAWVEDTKKLLPGGAAGTNHDPAPTEAPTDTPEPEEDPYAPF